MNIKIGYYPVLDMMLAFRQLYSIERFKPFNSIMTSIEGKLSEDEKNAINSVGDDTRGWLHVIERVIELALKGIVSTEEFILYTSDNPEVLWDYAKSDMVQQKTIDAIKSMWYSYIGSEIAKGNKTIFDKVMEISSDLKAQGLYNYLEKLTDRLVKVDENTLRVLIKPEHDICFDKLESVIIMPSIFASRKFTFWNSGNNHVFYISTDKYNLEEMEPSDMLLLKTLALNDRTRLKMLKLLMSSSYSTADMAESFDMNSSTISRHFKVFKDAGFVDIFSQEGNSVYYTINLDEIRRTMDMIMSYFKGDVQND